MINVLFDDYTDIQYCLYLLLPPSHLEQDIPFKSSGLQSNILVNYWENLKKKTPTLIPG
jgi:hypothetical protein